MNVILLVVQTIIAIFLIVTILLQRSDNDGFGMGSGGGGGLMSSRGQANLMTRTTAILAALFMANSLLLSILSARDASNSLIDQVAEEQPFQAPIDGAESSGMTLDNIIENAPTDEENNSIADPVNDATSKIQLEAPKAQ